MHGKRSERRPGRGEGVKQTIQWIVCSLNGEHIRRDRAQPLLVQKNLL